ncbi:MAG: type II toxin-antitoxin system PemK/MazF family toxin [Candidatus Rokubacteria bacterium]|nr:type II toxin-antitoxin system PemK/MazF family toxin [Candidatus Rokubacteria bacterium]MBI4593311.1 type II toxin-antitoxin system PemK/MazF family toxin [Candidatus Rokubacteria bacterium]
MRRGDVLWADLSPRSGSEQRGWRPVILVSHDGFNALAGWRSVIVVPLSRSGAQARRGPTAVPLSTDAGGLAKPGVALCHQVTTLDRGKLGRRIGALSSDTLAAIDRGLRIALDLV